jgi:hypothetical protein
LATRPLPAPPPVLANPLLAERNPAELPHFQAAPPQAVPLDRRPPLPPPVEPGLPTSRKPVSQALRPLRNRMRRRSQKHAVPNGEERGVVP